MPSPKQTDQPGVRCDGRTAEIRGDYDGSRICIKVTCLLGLRLEITILIQKMNLDEMVDDAEYYLEDGYQRQPQALVLVPTREIAIQVSDDINKLLPRQLKCVSLYSDPQ